MSLLVTGILYASAQQCVNKYTSVIHRGPTYDTFTVAVSTTQNELVAAGNVLDDHSLIAKFSSKGNALFSYQYNPVYQFNTTYYKWMKFMDIVPTKDGGFIIAGVVFQETWVLRNLYQNYVGILLKIDRYGNILWCKKFDSANSFRNSGFNIGLTNVIETSSGDLIVYLASTYGRNYSGYSKVICFNSTGVQKWTRLIATGEFDGGVSSLKI